MTLLYSGTEETMCTTCAHREVCSLTKEFIAAQNAVNDLTVHFDDDGGPRAVMKNLRDFKWIKRVKLECSHYFSNPTFSDCAVTSRG